MSEASCLEVFISGLPGETRLAITANGRLVDLVIARDFEPRLLGNIYLGRVEKVIASLNAAFIDIGQTQSGFLAAADGQIFDRKNEKPKPISALLKEGDAVVVQVSREASTGKGAKLSTRLDLPGRNLVATPGRGGLSISKAISDAADKERLRAALSELLPAHSGFIVRTKAQFAPEDSLRREAAALLAQISEIAAGEKALKPPACLHRSADPITRYLQEHGNAEWQRILVDDRRLLKKLADYAADHMPELAGLFELAADPVALFESHDLESQIDELFQARVTLPSGGALIIEETAALVAIDVDSAKNVQSNTSGRDPEAFAVGVNREAAEEIARQIGLRNLAGQIVIDFLPMKRQENRAKIQSSFADALDALADGGNCNIYGFSRLGLLELTRRRQGESLAARFLVNPGQVWSLQSLALTMFRAILRALARNPGKSLTVQCSVELYGIIGGEMKPVWQALLERTGPVVVIERAENLSTPQFDIRTH